MRDWYEDMAGEEHKAEIVARHMARLRTDSPPEPEAITARKRAEAADRLMRQDAANGLEGGLIGSLDRLVVHTNERAEAMARMTGRSAPPRFDRPAFTAADDGRQAETSDD
jgi:non-canonical (house-cleaning) NTP pyrophosphatase